MLLEGAIHGGALMLLMFNCNQFVVLYLSIHKQDHNWSDVLSPNCHKRMAASWWIVACCRENTNILHRKTLKSCVIVQTSGSPYMGVCAIPKMRNVHPYSYNEEHGYIFLLLTSLFPKIINKICKSSDSKWEPICDSNYKNQNLD